MDLEGLATYLARRKQLKKISDIDFSKLDEPLRSELVGVLEHILVRRKDEKSFESLYKNIGVNTKTEHFEELLRYYINKGDPYSARSASYFLKRGLSIEELQAIRNACINSGQLWRAQKAQSLVNKLIKEYQGKVPKLLIEKVGKAVFEAILPNLTTTDYAIIGDICIENGKPNDAENSYKKTKERITPERHKKIGKAYEDVWLLKKAREHYKDAGYTEGFARIEKKLQRVFGDSGLNVYTSKIVNGIVKAEKKSPSKFFKGFSKRFLHLFIAEKIFSFVEYVWDTGKLDQFIKDYKKAGYSQGLVNISEACKQKGNFKYAISSLIAARDIEGNNEAYIKRFKEIGKKSLDNAKFEYAVNAFKEAQYTKGITKIINILAEKYLAKDSLRNWMINPFVYNPLKRAIESTDAKEKWQEKMIEVNDILIRRYDITRNKNHLLNVVFAYEMACESVFGCKDFSMPKELSEELTLNIADKCIEKNLTKRAIEFNTMGNRKDIADFLRNPYKTTIKSKEEVIPALPPHPTQT